MVFSGKSSSSQTFQRGPPSQNQGHSRSSSLFSFRNKSSQPNQSSRLQKTPSSSMQHENGLSPRSTGAPTYGSPLAQSHQGQQTSSPNAQYHLSSQPQSPNTGKTQQQKQAIGHEGSPDSPLARAPSLQRINQRQSQPPPAPPPLHPEIRSVVQLVAAHAHKIYFSGPLVRKIERQPDGQRPAKDSGWCDVWAQLGGTTLSIWDMSEIQEASRQGKEVPPTYVNTTDAFVQVLGSVTTPATPTSPSKKYSNVLTLNTAGSNLLLFSCPSPSALISWAAALRLSAWEKSRLEEMYTAHLLRITLKTPNAPSTLVRGRMEGWARIRVSGQTDWKRMWMVVTAGTEGGSAEVTPGGGAISAVVPKKKRMSNLFSRDSSAVQHMVPEKPMISMYASQKPKDKKKALLTLKDVTQAFAVYPERPELISRSTLIKVEGKFGEEETAAAMKSREGWLLIMPELEGGLGQAEEMLKWVVALHDAFETYGRPEAWTWDPRDPISLLFAYPVGPSKDLLFLDRELAETLDPRDERTSSIRSRLIGMLLDRMHGHEISPKMSNLASSDSPLALPPIGSDTSGQQLQQNIPGLDPQDSSMGPQLPPLSFGEISPRASEQGNNTVAPEEKNGHANENIGSRNIQYDSLHQQSVQHDQYLSDNPNIGDSSFSGRALSSSPVQASMVHPSSQAMVTGSGLGQPGYHSPSPSRGLQPHLNLGTSPPHFANPSGSYTSPGNANPMQPGGPSSPMTTSNSLLTPAFVTTNSVSNQAFSSIATPTSPPAAASETGPPLTTVSIQSPSMLGNKELNSPHNFPHSPPVSPTMHPSSSFSHGTPDAVSGPNQWAQTSPKSSNFSPSQMAPQKTEEHNLSNEAGALYYIQQQLDPQSQQARVAEQDDDSDTSSSRHSASQNVSRPGAISPSSYDSNTSRKHPVRQSTPMAFYERSSPQNTSTIAPADHSSPSRQGQGPAIGRKPSGARAQTTRSFNGDGIPSQEVAENTESEEDSPKPDIKLTQDRPMASAEDPDLDALAALSYLETEDKPTSPKLAKVEPLHVKSTKAPSPPPAAPEPPSQFKSSFAPSKQATERKAKAQAQQAAHHAAVHKPGRANGKRKSRVAGTWNESSEEEDDEEEDEDEDADSDAEPSSNNRQAFSSSNTSRQGEQGAEQPSQQYSQLRPPRTLPQIPGNQNYPEDYNVPPRRVPSDQFSGAPGARVLPDGTQIRTQSEYPNPGTARQSVWSQVLDPGRNANVEPPRNDTFVQLEPSEAMTKAFTPQGLLSAGMQDKQDRSAKRQEELARETGASLINVPNKPPPPQMGLLGAITAHERERKREGGVGAALTEREREKRMAEDRQRRFDEHQRQQLDQMQQGGSMYGGQYPGYMNPMMMMNPMMGMNPMMSMNPIMTGAGMNPMMTGGGLNPMITGGGMSPMMTGQMGNGGMMPGFNPQHMFAAQQAAQAYQQAMIAFSVAGSQMGTPGEGGGATPNASSPMMTGGNIGAFDPRMSMMGMPMMGQMAPLGMQMTGMSAFDPRFPPNNDSGLAPPGGFGAMSSGNSSPARRGSPAQPRPAEGGQSSRPDSPKS